jgi:hypothetical protein
MAFAVRRKKNEKRQIGIVAYGGNNTHYVGGPVGE